MHDSHKLVLVQADTLQLSSFLLALDKLEYHFFYELLVLCVCLRNWFLFISVCVFPFCYLSSFYVGLGTIVSILYYNVTFCWCRLKSNGIADGMETLIPVLTAPNLSSDEDDISES